MTILELKNIIEEREGTPQRFYIFIYDFRELQDEKTLA
jgi:hypothetical protein